MVECIHGWTHLCMSQSSENHWYNMHSFAFAFAFGNAWTEKERVETGSKIRALLSCHSVCICIFWCMALHISHSNTWKAYLHKCSVNITLLYTFVCPHTQTHANTLPHDAIVYLTLSLSVGSLIKIFSLPFKYCPYICANNPGMQILYSLSEYIRGRWKIVDGRFWAFFCPCSSDELHLYR